jgi:hypothetical protein
MEGTQENSMKTRSVVLASLAAIGLAVAGWYPVPAMAAPPPTAGPVAGSWSPARQVPGTLPADSTYVNAVSCVPRGACVAGGYGINADGTETSFVVSEERGTWGARQPVPGLASLPGGGIIQKLSCPAPGDCLAAGQYGTTAVNGFVIQEAHGTWRKPLPIPGLAAMDSAGQAAIDALSCPAPGYCTVAGTYETDDPKADSNPQIAFIADEVAYRWRTAIQVPGLAALNSGRYVAGTLLACPAPGNCTLAGEYTPGPQGVAVFLDSEVRGRWRSASAARVPGLTAAGIGLLTAPVACASAGNCVTAGVYTASATGTRLTGFLLTQSRGRWSTATTLAGMRYVAALACLAVGRCIAGGTDARGIAAIMQEAHGKWGRPAELPGATRLAFEGKPAQFSEVDSLACPSLGNCSADGTYRWGQAPGDAGNTEVFVAGQARGTWSPALTPVGAVAFDVNGDAFPASLSCAAAAQCAMAASYTTGSGNDGAFMVTEVPERESHRGHGAP